jgi:crossover junction endodeoxyribonuclease RuvC
MKILGVDPGTTGALALFDTVSRRLVVEDMPVVRVVTRSSGQKRPQIADPLLSGMIRQFAPDIAFLERVHALPKQGVTSTFTFGMSYGIVRGVLAALNIPVNLVTPQQWKSTIRVGRDKAEARLIAARLFPDHGAVFSRVRDDGRAEAALLAWFGAHHGLSIQTPPDLP